MPVDAASIIIVGIALFGTILQVIRLDTLRGVIAKYRDPLYRATEDLFFELNNIISSPFMLWTGEQLGISEIMVVRDAKEDGGQARCMGYATFCQRWRGRREIPELACSNREGNGTFGQSSPQEAVGENGIRSTPTC
ncbi:hypothetical protein WG66_015841 [Moniliophthora roreri]|nr:hypothetical protein WG66_015841 [Moniliophthora roreri]